MTSLLRIGIGVTFMAAATILHAVVLLVLLPSRNLRIRSCNLWGWFVGRVCMALSGSTVRVVGAEHLDGERPCIYVSNHTSALDIFLGIWQAPVGTVGVAKKEVVWYPFFGQLYALSGHLRLDRGHHGRALAAMADLADVVSRHHLSIWMWPEGTRSRDGVLRPFKKGVYHLALATDLPVVPVIVAGAHRAWRKGSTQLDAVPITVTVLPAIDTTAWRGRDAGAVVDELHALFVEHLPADQRPAVAQ